MPVDAVVYTTVFTLVVFLILRIPFIWQGVDFSKGNTKSNLPAGGASAIMLGLMTLTIQYTMGSTHTWGGVNYADAFNTSMTAIGIGLLFLLAAGLPVLSVWPMIWNCAVGSRVRMRRICEMARSWSLERLEPVGK